MNPYKYQEYFDWLCDIVGAGPNGDFCMYKNLLTRLFQTNFCPCRRMDDNREVNGKMLRYYYESNHYDYGLHEQSEYHINGDFYDETYNEPCSMLEMLIAFAKDIDNNYLYSRESRMFVWFWTMIESMGLADFLDGCWDISSGRSEVEMILRSFELNAYQYDEYGHWMPTVCVFPIYNKESYEHALTLWEQMLVWYNEQLDYLENLNASEFINQYTCRHMYG